ncbi:hypothetical protein [Halobaculum halobium]|uniref:Uncharacterized protein n=1 Tax=Halobaculum halobium TaxID=3032281 RepID=A0ABD5TBQ6_9EURY|nr:hypothetical protein [Halobaculum sp. SYNS20]
MSSRTLGEVVKGLLSALGDALDAVIGAGESEPDPDNRPPITPSAKAIETWPTESQHEHDPIQQPFQGHPKPLGGDL